MKIYKKLYILLLALLPMTLWAQELKCTVTVNSDQIQGVSKQTFEALRQSIEEVMNQTQWTNMTFMETERIECSMLVVVNSVDDNLMKCEMTLQSRRPVFGTNYNSTVINFQDKNFTFRYQEFDRIEYQPTQFTTNLAALIGFYSYLIIGHDMDTFSKLGGTPYYNICENIINLSQSASIEDSEAKGWKAFDSNRNRYAILSNIKDEAFRPYREYVYAYHRQGLDIMADNAANGRARIAEGLPVLRTCYNARPATYVINTFLDAKSDELIHIFQGGSDREKDMAIETLSAIDPTRSTEYEKIKKQK